MSKVPGINPPQHDQQDLLDAGEQSDRNQLTRAGRAIQKHLSRQRGNDWRNLIRQLGLNPQLSTAVEYNEIGQSILEYVVSNAQTVWFSKKSLSTGQSIDARLPNGLGARWDDTLLLFFRTLLD